MFSDVNGSGQVQTMMFAQPKTDKDIERIVISQHQLAHNICTHEVTHAS
jgi:hypothetical protein